MKPNEFKISTVLCIIIIIMTIRITDSLAENPRYCGKLTINNRNSERYLRIHNNSVLADSDNKYYFYSVTIEKSYQFFLYDQRTDRFVCVNNKKAKRRKLTAKRMPNDAMCLFEEKTFDNIPSSPNIQLLQRNHNFTMRFDKNGMQHPSKKIRHKHARKQESLLSVAFLQKKLLMNSGECDHLRRHFCLKMRPRYRKRLPEQIRTFCKLDSTTETA